MEYNNDNTIYPVVVLGSCSYDDRIRVVIADPSKSPLSLPYMSVFNIELDSKTITFRPVIPQDRIKGSIHHERMTGRAPAFIYAFSSNLDSFWDHDFVSIREWLAITAKIRPFLVFVHIVDSTAMSLEHVREQTLRNEIDIYSHLGCGDFLYHTISNEASRTQMWTQIATQLVRQRQL